MSSVKGRSDASAKGTAAALEERIDPMLSTQARGTAAKLSLVRAGIQEFGEYGPEGASIRKIAQRAGQNVAAIAYYFGSKQGLYLATAGYIGDSVTRRMGPLLDEIDAFLGQPRRTPAQCLKHLRRMLDSTFTAGDELVALSQMIVREQTHPTVAFDVLFKSALERPHRIGTALIAAYAGADPKADEAEFVVHYHMLLGSILAFRVARETLLRRLGRTDIADDDKFGIGTMVSEHVGFVLRGLRAARARQTGTGR